VSLRVRRVTTTRTGGVSAPPFDTFNLGDHVGDDAAAVTANRSRLLAAVGLPGHRAVWMNQVHGTRIEVVDGPRRAALDDTDGVVTATAEGPWSIDPESGEIASVRLGTLDPGHDVRPTFRTFVDYAAGWEPIPDDGLERYPESRAR